MLSRLLSRPRLVRLPAQNGTVKVQRVKFARQVRRPASLWLASFLLTLCIARTSDYWLPSEFRKAIESLDKTQAAESKPVEKQTGETWRRAHEQTPVKGAGHQEEDEVAKQDDSIFLTFPIWMRMKNVAVYRDSDAEWREFVKLQSDDARMEALFRNIAEESIKKFRRRPDAKNILQKIGYSNKINVSLEVLIPFRPPAVFEVPGLKITPNGVAWAWRTLPEHYGSKLHRVTHPVVFFRAFWAGLRVFCKVSVSHIGTGFGDVFSKKSTSTIIETLRGPSSRSKRKSTAQQEDEGGDLPLDPEIDTENSKQVQAPSMYPFDPKAVLQSQKALLGTVSSESAVKQAVTTFQATFMRQQLAAWRELPRGACMIEGWIDYLGEFGMVRSQVHIIYVPSKDRFLGEPVVERMNIFPYAPAISSRLAELKAEAAQKASIKPPQPKSGCDQQEEDPSDDEEEQEQPQEEAVEPVQKEVESKKPRGNSANLGKINPEESDPPHDTKSNPVGQKIKTENGSQEKPQQKKDRGEERPP